MFIFLIKTFHRKAILLIAFMGSVFAITKSNAQKTHETIAVSLPVGNIRLDSLSERLRLQSGYILSFNAGSIQPASTIRLLNTPVYLGNLLDYLKGKYGFSYTVLGHHIILDRMSKSKPETGEAFIPVRKSQAGESPVSRGQLRHWTAKDSAVLKQTKDAGSNDFRLPQTGLIQVKGRFTGISIPAVPAFIISPPHVSGNGKPGTGARVFTGDTGASYHGGRRTNAIDKWLLSGGLTADESFYLAPAIKLGFPYLYLTGIWRTNFTISGFGYGIGSSYKFTKTWGVQVNVSRGALKNSFLLDSGLAPAPPPVSTDSTLLLKIKGTLLRGELFIDNRITDRLTLQFGPVLNLLDDKRYTGGKLIAEVSSFPENTNINKKYYLLNPPYLITDAYNKDKSSGRKVWIGLQLGLFYRF